MSSPHNKEGRKINHGDGPARNTLPLLFCVKSTDRWRDVCDTFRQGVRRYTSFFSSLSLSRSVGKEAVSLVLGCRACVTPGALYSRRSLPCAVLVLVYPVSTGTKGSSSYFVPDTFREGCQLRVLGQGQKPTRDVAFACLATVQPMMHDGKLLFAHKMYYYIGTARPFNSAVEYLLSTAAFCFSIPTHHPLSASHRLSELNRVASRSR
ncbi:hypothetical protein QBC35DRAFT_169821 [Podospora australis]|uniref:Uncharacterized protein n=1 Tax=Podospora australis TaxID=1536484 RepID=A0AAN7AJJ7_9PEZI|nr:hypothetical protein QBC35DRAFT_169821 [Podospora australis]